VLPLELKLLWSCRFAAFLKYGPLLRPFEDERQAFVAYARQHPDDPDVPRYSGFARAVAEVRGSLRESPWGNSAFLSFMKTETQVRDRLLETLDAVREAFMRAQHGGADAT
jgi:hypothetical protein